MKHLLLVIFCFAFTANLFAENYSADTVLLETWVNNAWQPYNRSVNTFDAGCREQSSINQNWDVASSSWVNVSQTTFTYLGDGNLGEMLIQQWDGSGWGNTSKTSFTYDGSSRELTTTSQFWSAGAWFNASRTTNTYDAGGHLTSTLSENSLDGVTWTNQGLTTYTINADGTVNQEVSQNWNLVTSSWDNSQRTSFTYNADKTVNQATYQTWDVISSSWVNSSRYTYSYDAQGRQLTTLNEIWQANAWVNNTLNTITYHGSGNQFESYVTQSWINNAWVTTTRDDYTYDNNDNVFQRVIQNATQNTNYQLVNDLRYTYHYILGCALPLTLLDFTATLSGKDVLVKWTTTNEANTSYFDVQRSTNANNFDKAGTVAAANYSTRKINYQFIDANPTAIASGQIYYRLKMVDRNGKFSYSKIALVALPRGENYFSVFPTLVKDNLFITNNTTYRGNAEIKIFDQAGRQVYTQRLNIQQTVNQSTINVSSLNTGVYHIQMTTKDGSNTVKFLKN